MEIIICDRCKKQIKKSETISLTHIWKVKWWQICFILPMLIGYGELGNHKSHLCAKCVGQYYKFLGNIK